MSVKEQILKDIKNIESPQLLNQLFEYLQIVKQNDNRLRSNRDKVLQFAGLLTDKEARRINRTIDEAFSNIEGEW